jgi:hypothetical protein
LALVKCKTLCGCVELDIFTCFHREAY